MTPATNVPWNERSRSSGALFAPGPAKPRATITFGVVAPPGPFGKPGGYENPVGSRNGCSWSTPSSTTATFTPSPRAPGQRRELRRADDRRAAVESRRVREARVDVRRDPRLEELRKPAVRDAHREAVDEHLVAARHHGLAGSPRGARDRPRLRRLEACRGTSARTRSAGSACACAPSPAKPRANVAAASGGSSSVMMTRTRLPRSCGTPAESGAGRTFSSALLDDAARRAIDASRPPSRWWRRRRRGRRGARGVARAAVLANLPRVALRRLQAFERDRHRSAEGLALRAWPGCSTCRSPPRPARAEPAP